MIHGHEYQIMNACEGEIRTINKNIEVSTHFEIVETSSELKKERFPSRNQLSMELKRTQIALWDLLVAKNAKSNPKILLKILIPKNGVSKVSKVQIYIIHKLRTKKDRKINNAINSGIWFNGMSLLTRGKIKVKNFGKLKVNKINNSVSL